MSRFRRVGGFSSELVALVALGQIRSRAEVTGSTTNAVPGFPAETVAGGFFVSPEMIGETDSRRFAVAPQARVNLAYAITRNMRFAVQYNFLFIDRVVRPDAYTPVVRSGSSIGSRPNVTSPPSGTGTPDDSVWMQGVSLGLIYNY